MKYWIALTLFATTLSGCTTLETTESEPVVHNEVKSPTMEAETDNITDSAITWLQYDADFSNLRILYPEGWGLAERDNLLTMTSTENSNFAIHILFNPNGNPENYYADSYISNILDPKYALTQNEIAYRKEMIGQRDAVIIPGYGSAETAVDMTFIIDGNAVYSITYPSLERFTSLNAIAYDIISQLTFVDSVISIDTENLANIDTEYFSFLYPKEWIKVEQVEENVLLKLYIVERENAFNAESSTVFTITLHQNSTLEQVEQSIIQRLTETTTEDILISNVSGTYVSGNSWGREANVLLPGKNSAVLEITIVSNIAQSKETVSQILRTFYVE